jgi:hypothetical protein
VPGNKLIHKQLAELQNEEEQHLSNFTAYIMGLDVSMEEVETALGSLKKEAMPNDKF